MSIDRFARFGKSGTNNVGKSNREDGFADAWREESSDDARLEGLLKDRELYRGMIARGDQAVQYCRDCGKDRLAAIYEDCDQVHRERLAEIEGCLVSAIRGGDELSGSFAAEISGRMIVMFWDAEAVPLPGWRIVEVDRGDCRFIGG